MGGGEDLGVDDGQEEHGEGVDDGDADQADRHTRNIGDLVTRVELEVRLEGLEDRYEEAETPSGSWKYFSFHFQNSV